MRGAVLHIVYPLITVDTRGTDTLVQGAAGAPPVDTCTVTRTQRSKCVTRLAALAVGAALALLATSTALASDHQNRDPSQAKSTQQAGADAKKTKGGASGATGTKTKSTGAAAGTSETKAAGAQSPPRAKPSKNCAKQIIADWFPDQRIDLVYELHCYRDAIKTLPKDVLVYTDAPADMQRALSFARKNQPDPGRPGSEPPPATTDTTDTTGTAAGGSTSGGGTPDTSGPSSVPVPLIVLGGLAVLLLAAGGAGYISRRMRAEAEGDGDASAAS